MNTTKKLRYKIMAIMTFLLSLTLLLILVAINIFKYNETQKEMNDVAEYYLSTKAEPVPAPNDSPNAPDKPDKPDKPANSPASGSPGSDSSDSPSSKPKDDFNFSRSQMPPKELEQLMNAYSLIYVKYSSEDTFESMESNHTDAYSEDDIKKYCEEILDTHKETGSIESFYYIKRHIFDSYQIVLLDSDIATRSSRSLLISSVFFGMIGLIAFALISYVISKIIVKPVEKAFDQQKNFICAASHELKTPLTIIQANSEILEDQYGKSKWLTYLQSECQRMGTLISSLLTLSRLDNQEDPLMENASDFNLSDSLLERILSFESVAYEKNITFTYEIEPDITFYGIRNQLQQLLTIFLDNALFYTPPQGTIKISLSGQNHQITLKVSNTGEPISKEDQQKIFDRFYRVDKARSRDHGHFGLGLSIAKDITDKHKGTINVDCSNGVTTFIVCFSSTPRRT